MRPIILLLCVAPLSSELSEAAATCSSAKRREVLARATEAQPSVRLDCNLALEGSAYLITKRIDIRGEGATGVRFDCGGSKIAPLYAPENAVLVQSRYLGDGIWSRPSNVRVSNCRVQGGVRISGFRNVDGERIYYDSSYRSGHTARAQANSPTGIVFDRLTIDGNGLKDIVYLGSGTTYSSLIDSEIKGSISGVPLYLDAESANNRIEGNYIHASTDHREQMAVDGSARNKIYGNRFSGLNHGGIYLYRNCGEKGTVRQQPPQHNEIVNNSFYYNTYDGDRPAVWIGSRHKDLPGYCDEDDTAQYGSGVSDMDFAWYNVVAESQIYKLAASKMIRDDDSYNLVTRNVTVSEAQAHPSGCVLTFGTRKAFIGNGETYARRIDDSSGILYECDDSYFTATAQQAERITFGCSVTGNDAGCSRVRACPVGRQLMSLRAACNLEYGPVSDAELATVGADRIRVTRASDVVSDGSCRAGALSISSGSADAFPILGTATSFSYGCREKDGNGGDCAIRGEAFCL